MTHEQSQGGAPADETAVYAAAEPPTPAAATEPGASPWPGPTGAGGPPVPDSIPAVERLHLAGYDVLLELGRGGMGVVYLARQRKLQRVVALKMILAGGHAGGAELLRFLGEAAAVAQLQHPNLVPLFESGQQDGLPYFTLEYVPGGSLAQKLRGGPLPPGDAAGLVQQLARGMHYAHQRGIIHRDLKPANVLLAEDDTPKITDFGLAKWAAAGEGLTASGDVMGTPSYMAPEQADGKSKDVGPAADVYALGAILYECLTGRPPFQGPTSLETLHQVVRDEPVAPGRLQPRTPRDLDTICLKCLHKEPARRYADAGALAEDLRRFRAGEPILARPAGPLERAAKWARRRPAAAAVLAVSVLATAVVIGLLAYGNGEISRRNAEIAQKQRDTDEALRKEQHVAYQYRIAQANAEWEGNNGIRAEQILDECPPELRRWEWYYLKRRCRQALLSLPGHGGPRHRVAFRPDGRRLAAADGPVIKIWDATTGRMERTLTGHGEHVSGLAYSPDGTRLASSSPDETVRVWDPEAGREVSRFACKAALGVAFGPDGQTVAATSSNQVKLWDVATGREVRTFGNLFTAHQLQVNAVAFSKDGRLLASAGEDATVKVWETASGGLLLTFRQHGGPVTCVGFSPDGKLVASGSTDKTVKVWQAQNGTVRATLPTQAAAVLGVAWSPDGTRLASGGGSQQFSQKAHELKIWDATSGQELRVLRGHADAVESVAFSGDGELLASAGGDHTVKVWEATGRRELLPAPAPCDKLLALAFRPDGRALAAAGQCLRGGDQRGLVQIWDVATGQERRTLRGHKMEVLGLAWSPDGQLIVTGGMEPLIAAWRPDDGTTTFTLAGHRHKVSSLAFSPDGRRLASGSFDDKVIIWDLAGRREVRALLTNAPRVYALAFGADGGTVATPVGTDVVLWDVETGREVRRFRGHGKTITGVAFRRDGWHLAASGADQTVRVWDVDSGEQVLMLKGHVRTVAAVAFSPDGERLASAGFDETVRIWHATTGEQLLTLRGHSGMVAALAFSPDGGYLASAGWDGMVRLWDARP
jgi:WD40 repeat protein